MEVGGMDLKHPTVFREQAFFCGRWADSGSGNRISVENPATGEVIGSVPALTRGEVGEAIDFAGSAMEKWQKTSCIERSAVLRKWHGLLLEHLEDLSLLLTLEQGKPLKEAQGEILYGASYIEWFAEEAKRIYGDTIPAPSADRRIVVLKQPIGLCAAITPWNFPNAMITRKVAPALAAGCAILLKPASQTPFSALALASLALEAGLPAGLFSVLTGEAKEVGPGLVESPKVRKLSFTGSTGVGKKLLAECAQTVKRVTMELGGNAPFIVFEDADLDAAVDGAIVSKFRNSGQTCVCANRIYAHRNIAGEFSRRLAEKVAEFRIGNGLDPETTHGPLIDEKAVRSVEDLLSDALQNGALLVSGGAGHPAGRNFFRPTILTGCSAQMRIAREEIFGPVAPIFEFSTEEEVVRLANATEVGLASYFYSRDIGKIWRVAEALEYGMVGINTGLISNAMAPFGGVKESGMGREGSKYGIEDYLSIKYLCLAGLDQ